MRMLVIAAALLLLNLSGSSGNDGVSLLDDLHVGEDATTSNTSNVVDDVKGPLGSQQTLKAMWSDVPKNAASRVDLAAFKTYFTTKYGSANADDQAQAAYATYLDTIFTTSTNMMLPVVKTDLGRHCFTYAAAMAGEAPSQSTLRLPLALTD